MAYDLEAEKRAKLKRDLDKENTVMGAVKGRIGEIASGMNPANWGAAKPITTRAKSIDDAVDKATDGQHGQADRTPYNWSK